VLSIPWPGSLAGGHIRRAAHGRQSLASRRGGTLVNPISGKCLDDPRFNTTNGTLLELFTCNGGKNQLWELPKPSVTPVTPSR